MKEWKAGRWVSQKQALAVSYSQTRVYMKKRKTLSKKYSPKHKRSNLKKKTKRKVFKK